MINWGSVFGPRPPIDQKIFDEQYGLYWSKDTYYPINYKETPEYLPSDNPNLGQTYTIGYVCKKSGIIVDKCYMDAILLDPILFYQSMKENSYYGFIGRRFVGSDVFYRKIYAALLETKEVVDLNGKFMGGTLNREIV